MTEESPFEGRCAQCARRLLLRQAVIDWAPVITVVIGEVVRYLSE